MCFIINKWRKFEPTQNYLDVVKYIKTITELDYFLDRIKYTSDKKDYWQTPEETLNRGKGDCEDFARFAIDVLVRIQKRKNVRFICYFGYNGKKKTGHAVTVFPYNGKYSVFSNRSLLHQYDSYVDVGHEFYPDGLKYMEIRDWTGKISSKKHKWLGVF